MSNNTLKFIFLFVVIGVVLFSRAAYPHFSAMPSLSADEAQQTVGTSTDNSKILVLPVIDDATETSVSAAADDPKAFASATATSAGGPADYVVGDSTPAFSKIANDAPPRLADAASLVADLSNGIPLLSLNMNTRWPLASLTKLMTATVVFDNLPLNKTVTITPQMFAVDPQEFTVQIGGTYSVGDLLRVLLLPSSNVAAEALADTYGRAQFLALMNSKAAQWGMGDTYYDDPSGLSSANESTAHDLLLLTQEIYQNYPQIFAITRVPHVVITNYATNAKVSVTSIDNFAGTSDFIGGKTGHTNEASGNLLTVLNYSGHPMLVVVLGTNDRFGDSTKLFNWAKADYR